MSLKYQKLVWDCSKAAGGARLVLLALADYCSNEGKGWRPVADIARVCRLSERQVQRHLASLAELGEVVLDNAGGRRRALRFQLRLVALLPGFEAAEPTETVTQVSPFVGEKGDIHDRKRVTSMSPDPVLDPLRDPLSDSSLPPYPRKRGLEETGRGLREVGVSLRQQGRNPRAQGTSPRQRHEQQEQAEFDRLWQRYVRAKGESTLVEARPDAGQKSEYGIAAGDLGEPPPSAGRTAVIGHRDGEAGA